MGIPSKDLVRKLRAILKYGELRDKLKSQCKQRRENPTLRAGKFYTIPNPAILIAVVEGANS
jgi:hypothetical protein